MMLNAWKWYQRCLALHPVKTQIISSGLLWGVGDVAAQAITHCTLHRHNLHNPTRMFITFSYTVHHKIGLRLLPWFIWSRLGYAINSEITAKELQDGVEEFKINWKRVAVTSMFGFGFVGPVGHFWYEGLDRFVRLRLQLQPKSLRFVGAKVATDALVFGPLDLVVFFTYMGLSSGKSVSQVKEDVKRDFIPAFVLGGGVWPIVQVANFKFVPVRYQLLYVNIFCLLDSAFLSWLEQQQDAPWKKWFVSFLGLEEKERQG